MKLGRIHTQVGKKDFVFINKKSTFGLTRSGSTICCFYVKPGFNKCLYCVDFLKLEEH